MERIKARRNDNLKTIAMLTMLIDHLGHMHLISDAWYTVSRTIGRVAFPIFAYQIALGFEKTSNRKSYAGRLFLFGLLAQIPYIWFNPDGQAQWLHFNIMFLLLAGLGVLSLSENMEGSWKNYRETGGGKNLLETFFWGFILILAIAAPETLTILCLQRGIEISFEYSSYGLLMMLFFHWWRKDPLRMTMAYVLLSVIGVYLTSLWVAVKYGPQITGGDLGYFQAMGDSEIIKMVMFRNGIHFSLQGVWFQTRSLLAIPVIYLMEGYKGRAQIHLPRVVGYLFYPVHIAILLLVSMQ